MADIRTFEHCLNVAHVWPDCPREETADQAAAIKEGERAYRVGTKPASIWCCLRVNEMTEVVDV